MYAQALRQAPRPPLLLQPRGARPLPTLVPGERALCTTPVTHTTWLQVLAAHTLTLCPVGNVSGLLHGACDCVACCTGSESHGLTHLVVVCLTAAGVRTRVEIAVLEPPRMPNVRIGRGCLLQEA